MDQQNQVEQKPKSMRMQKQSAKQYATTSFIGGLISLVFLGLFLGPVALISGIVAFAKSKKEPLSTKHKVFAAIGILLGLLVTYVQLSNFGETLDRIR